MSLPLDSLRDYVNSLTWVESGNLTSDLTHVIDLIEADYDSRWFVHETRKAIVLLNFWSCKVRDVVRSFELKVAVSRDTLDKPSRDALQRDKRIVKQRSIDAYTMQNPEHQTLVHCLQQYEMVLGVIDGISLALDTSLVVQEAVSVRRQEMIDAGQL